MLLTPYLAYVAFSCTHDDLVCERDSERVRMLEWKMYELKMARECILNLFLKQIAGTALSYLSVVPV